MSCFDIFRLNKAYPFVQVMVYGTSPQYMSFLERMFDIRGGGRCFRLVRGVHYNTAEAFGFRV